ncbi:MAG: hypothetical protein ACPK85_00230 [Methanosarcina sp.]
MNERKLDTEGCQGFKLKNVNPEVFSCIRKKLQNYGIEFSAGNSGTFEGKGIIGYFNWDGQADLIIKIKERPLDTYCGQVSGKFRTCLRECLGY